MAKKNAKSVDGDPARSVSNVHSGDGDRGQLAVPAPAVQGDNQDATQPSDGASDSLRHELTDPEATQPPLNGSNGVDHGQSYAGNGSAPENPGRSDDRAAADGAQDPEIRPTPVRAESADEGFGAKKRTIFFTQGQSPTDMACEFFPKIPCANGASFIRIQPEAEERHAFDHLMRLMPALFTDVDILKIMQAYIIASYAHREQRRQSGEPYMLHPLTVTTILWEMLHMDSDTLAAGLLHDVAEDSEYGIDYIRTHFGTTISDLVDGVTKLKRIRDLSNPQKAMADSKAESMRKMFLAMVDDVRVVIIKLADRLHNMRTLGSQPSHKRKRIARETLDIFAPLANRLGIWQMKWELEDLSFRYVQPETYRELAKAMQQKRSEREKLVIVFKRELEDALASAGIKASVSGRPKHIYSIWKKMQRKDVDFEQIYDVHGFRVLVDTEVQCYAALGVVHSIWRPIPGEFDDYIANPKDNLYRSLHTAVVGKNGRPMEVQIRTQEMHEIAELGIAAHWNYKENGAHEQSYQQKIGWLRQIMEWRQDVTDPNEFIDGMKTDVFNDRVYIFTPHGDIIDLPTGATPIDFAYSIHTELGHRCRGANVNGKLVSLDYKLQTGDQVAIIAAKRGGPSRDWLNPNLEYVATQRARSKIRTWLRKQNREDNIQRGRQLLEKEMKRLSITDSFESMMKLFNHDKVDDFLAAIGYGEINSQHIAQRVLDNERKEQQAANWMEELNLRGQARSKVGLSDSSFQVQGVDGLLTNLARCCNPVPGDPIVGYVTRARGITVHRSNCPNIADKVRRGRNNQLVDVQWKTNLEQTFPVNIQVSAYDRAGLMRDIASLVADDHINMLSVEAVTGQKDNLALINATLEIENITQLTRILTKIDRLPNVVEAYRRVG